MHPAPAAATQIQGVLRRRRRPAGRIPSVAGRHRCAAGRHPEAAVALLATALRARPDDPDALMLLGLAMPGPGAVIRASPCCARRCAAPRPCGARLVLAGVLREAGALAEAVGELHEAIRRSPADATLHNELGLVLLNGHRLAEAEHSLGRAVALDPRYAIAHYNLACAQERQRHFAAAPDPTSAPSPSSQIPGRAEPLRQPAARAGPARRGARLFPPCLRQRPTSTPAG